MEKQQESAQDISWEKRLQSAVHDIIREMSRSKSEGSYYYSWQANIAMAFHDEFTKMLESGEIEAKFKNSFTFHDCCNNAAKRFLDQLCNESETTFNSDQSLADDKEQEQLEAENEKMRKALEVDGWIKIKDFALANMPDYDELVLWRDESGKYFCEMLDKDGNPWLEKPYRVTHYKKIIPPEQ